MTVSVLVVDDESDLEVLFRQQFRRELRAQRFVMEFAGSAAQALNRISDSGEQTKRGRLVGKGDLGHSAMDPAPHLCAGPQP